MDLDSESERQQAVIPMIGVEARMLPAPQDQLAKARHSFWRTVSDVFGAIRGYTVDDINRLKEGGVQQVEGKGQIAVAEAKAKVAEAAERHAKAEHERAEANKANAEAYAIRKKADIDSAEALIRVIEAISRLKQQGGNAVLFEEQLGALLLRGNQEFPKDPSIQLREGNSEP